MYFFCSWICFCLSRALSQFLHRFPFRSWPIGYGRSLYHWNQTGQDFPYARVSHWKLNGTDSAACGGRNQGMCSIFPTQKLLGTVCGTLLSFSKAKLHVLDFMQGPSISIDQPDIDFHLVRCQERASRPLWLRNQSQINCPWEARFPNNVAEHFQIVPSSGVLRPLQELMVSWALTSLPLPSKNEQKSWNPVFDMFPCISDFYLPFSIPRYKWISSLSRLAESTRSSMSKSWMGSWSVWKCLPKLSSPWLVFWAAIYLLPNSTSTWKRPT